MVVYLGGNRVDLWTAVARARQAGEVMVVSTGGRSADQADLAALPHDIPVFAASGAVVDRRVGYAREAAWHWLEDVGLRRPTAIGATLFDLMRDEERSPLWWISDITLQEKAFLAVRFVETLDHFLRTLQPTSVLICGADRDHPWQRRVFSEWMRARKIPLLPTRQVKVAFDRTEYSKRIPAANARDDLPIPELAPGQGGRPLEVSARIQPRVALDLMIRLLELIFSPLAAMVGAFALVVLGAGSVLAPTTVVARRSVRLLRTFILSLMALATGIILIIPLTLALLVLAVVVIVTAERADTVLDRRQLRTALARFDRRSLLRRAPSEVSSTSREAIPLILVVIDRGNERERVATNSRQRSTYNSYLEGVVTALRSAVRGQKVVVARYGSLPGGRLARALRRLRRLMGSDDVSVADMIGPPLWRAAERWRRIDAETGRSITQRDGLGQVFEYEGVALLEALRADLTTVFAILNERRIYVEAFRALIRTMRPTIIVSYNWEGVFRPLTEAAFRERTTLFGVQQALGPYGHAVDHRGAGYVRAGESGDGFRIPNRLAVWGALHAETLERYQFPHDVPVITGYPRLDPFVNVRPDRNAVRRRLRIAASNARLVIFSAVLRVIGTPLVRESDYIDMYDQLVSLTREDPTVYLVIKPWGGDDLARLRQIVWSRGNRNVRFLSADTDLHNADLLAGSDVLVGTFSSIVGEAVVAGCTPVMVNPAEARYYFGDEHVAHYDGITRVIDDCGLVHSVVREELDRTPEDRARIRSAALHQVEQVFGPIDGRSADRVAAAVLRAAAGRADGS